MCEWPKNIASIEASAFSTKDANSSFEPVASSMLPADEGPACASRIVMSGFSSEASSSWAALFTALTGSMKSIALIPLGDTRALVSFVTTPMTATLMPLTSYVVYAGNAGSSVPFFTTLAPRCSKLVSRDLMSSNPRSNSWLPTADASSPSASRYSRVGLSCCDDDA